SRDGSSGTRRQSSRSEPSSGALSSPTVPRSRGSWSTCPVGWADKRMGRSPEGSQVANRRTTQAGGRQARMPSSDVRFCRHPRRWTTCVIPRFGDADDRIWPMTGHVSLPNLPLTSLQQCGSNPHGRIEGPQLEDLAADVVNNPHERLRSPPTCTQAPTRPTRKRRPLCSGLFLVRYYYLSSLPLSTTTSAAVPTHAIA